MSIVSSLRRVVAGATTDGDADSSGSSRGAYWCHDCSERIPAADAPDDATPACPGCGEEMTFERTPDTGGCAC